LKWASSFISGDASSKKKADKITVSISTFNKLNLTACYWLTAIRHIIESSGIIPRSMGLPNFHDSMFRIFQKKSVNFIWRIIAIVGEIVCKNFAKACLDQPTTSSQVQ
jgi:hypothetical protein